MLPHTYMPTAYNALSGQGWPTIRRLLNLCSKLCHMSSGMENYHFQLSFVVHGWFKSWPWPAISLIFHR